MGPVIILLLLFINLMAEPCLIILVNARKLDYSSNRRFLATLAKHPSDWSKNGDVGHAWLCLMGNGVVIEGGHTGEFGLFQPKYFEEVIRRCQRGVANPVSYLHETLYDGRFQRGSGGHKPTFAVKINLSAEQFEVIREYIRTYNYEEYSLTRRQCVDFVCGAARLAGFDLDCRVDMQLGPSLRLGKEKYQLWSDPAFERLSFASPDRLEKLLHEAVLENRAESALWWYRRCHRETLSKKLANSWENLVLFPKRIRRLL